MKKFDISDIFILIGSIGMIIGIWLIFPPAAYIVAGLELIVIGIILGLSGSNNKSGG